jgi:hypothetical protein
MYSWHHVIILQAVMETLDIYMNQLIHDGDNKHSEVGFKTIYIYMYMYIHSRALLLPFRGSSPPGFAVFVLVNL